MKGWIIDARLNYEKNKIDLLIVPENHGKICLSISPILKVYLTVRDKSFLKNVISHNSEYIESYDIEEWYYPPWYRKSKKVWTLVFNDVKAFKLFINMIRGDNRFVIWNEFPDIEVQTLFRYSLPISTLINLSELFPYDDVWDIIYDPPPLRRVFIRLLDWYGDVVYPFRYKPREVQVRFRDIYEEYNMLFESIFDAIEYIKRFDPHVIEADNENVIKYVKKHLTMDSVIYIDYSKTVLNHLDFYGLLELSRISYTGLSKTSMSSIGKILTTIEALEALKHRRLIPNIRVDVENYKTPNMLLKVDRGGLVYTPNAGLYWNVAQCDYVSLYPSIIARYNIGNETVNYRGCTRFRVAPESKHKICIDFPSIVSLSLKKIIDRRIALKDLARKTKNPVIDARQRALKWISVASFGYLGYRNARFGKIEAYECVTSYARKILLNTIKLANEMGFNVIHVLVDSIWISKEDADINDYLSFCKTVSNKLSFRLDLETYYKWLYIPKNRSTDSIGSVNRYYGVDYKGNIKIKGIEAVRTDTPELIREFQVETIKMLSKARDIDHFIKLIKDIPGIYRRYFNIIRDFRVDLAKLIIIKRVNKRSLYKNLSIYRVLKQLDLSPPAMVRFIMSIDGPKAVELWRTDDVYDPNYYIKLLDSALKSLPTKVRYLSNFYLGLS